ncbi:FG-GAP repeat domain-containing protein [Terriglobus sp. YAF25]|uniref:FG-GAP repeat domain-containing protein n=1 Tax=Terriglobus sp. YAF25 TaxID=3233080 RepID=UPI003F9E684E
MNRLAAVGRIAVCLAFSIGLSAQTPTITVTPTGTAGVYTLAGQYTALAQVHPPTGNVTFEDTTYSNAVLGSAPFSSSLTSSIVQNGSQSFTSLYGYTSNVLARDFDGDGKADLLFVDNNYYLTFFKGNGDGTFQAGIADSLVTMQTATTMIRRGNGDGTFQAPTQFTETIPQYSHTSLQSGDFNGDGKLDLFSTGYYPSHLYLGNGDGTFAAAVNTNAAIGPVGDFNNDGRADIYGDNFTLLGLSNGTFQTVNHTSGPIGTQVTVADFNHDGKLDVAGFSGGNAMVALGNGDGTFQAVSTYSIDPGPGPINWYGSPYQFTYSSIASGDFNGDGVPDLAFLGNYPIQN